MYGYFKPIYKCSVVITRLLSTQKSRVWFFPLMLVKNQQIKQQTTMTETTYNKLVQMIELNSKTNQLWLEALDLRVRLLKLEITIKSKHYEIR